jgi:hypothetical protein
MMEQLRSTVDIRRMLVRRVHVGDFKGSRAVRCGAASGHPPVQVLLPLVLILRPVHAVNGPGEIRIATAILYWASRRHDENP